MTSRQFETFLLIRSWISEGTEEALKLDGHCKSSEGQISLHYDPFFWRKGASGLHVKCVEIYSYVLGPRRNHKWVGYSTPMETADVKYVAGCPLEAAFTDVKGWLKDIEE